MMTAGYLQIAYIFIICLLWKDGLCFLTPHSEELKATILSATDSNKHEFDSEIWHQPRFNHPFTSFWSYWRTTPAQKTNENIDYGTVKWSFNRTHMYYHFNIPSLSIQFHEYIMNDTLYLWTKNTTKTQCYSYKLEFNIIQNYFKNSSFVGTSSNSNDTEAIWIGYLFTEKVFGRNISYIATAKQNGSIGGLHITLNTDNINLQSNVITSEIMWLQNITWNESDIQMNLPNQCVSHPINPPTMSPTASPTSTPTASPSDPPSANVDSRMCSLPSTMVIIYVILIAFFLLLLFCWYARKTSVIARMIHGADQSHHSMTYSAERVHAHNYQNKNRYNKYKASKHHKKHVYKANDDRYNKQFVPRKTSDRYVGDDDSDIEYVAHSNINSNERYRKMSKHSNSDSANYQH